MAKQFVAVGKRYCHGLCWCKLFALSLVLCWGTAACSPLRLPPWLGGTAPTPTPTPVSVTSELAFWHWPLSPAEMANQQAVIERYEAQNPTVAINLTYTDAYARRLRTALGTDRPPDVIALNFAQVPDLVAAGHLAPLPTTLLADQDLYPHLRAAMQVDGIPYCLPLSFHTLALFYHKQRFDEVGQRYPDANWQWADLQLAAAALTDSESGHYGIVLSADFSRWLAFLYQAGGTVTTANGRAMAINSSAAESALTFYSNLILEGYSAQPLTLESSWPGQAFGTGKAAMVIEGSWLVPYLTAERPSLDYGVAPLPLGPGGGATLSFGSCLAITSASSHQKAALDFITIFRNAEQLAGWVSLSNAIPARLSVAEQWRATYPAQKPFIEQAIVAREWQLPAGFQPWLADRNSELQRIFGGFIPAEALLTAAEENGNQILAP